MSGRWVVLDYGHVISKPSHALGQLARSLGAREDEFAKAYWAHREAYDRGCTDREYWTAVGDTLGIGVDESMVHALTSTDIVGWLHVREDTLALIHELAAAGERLALLSNAPASFGAAVRQQEWSRHFRVLLFSGDLRMAKPDKDIWRTLCSTVDAEPGDCFFTDDRQSNVDAARTAGLHAEVFSSAADLRNLLA